MLPFRMNEIVRVLVSVDSISAGELAQQFTVSTRTIYRDLDSLAELGIPILTQKGKGGGIQIARSFDYERFLEQSSSQPCNVSGLVDRMQELGASSMALPKESQLMKPASTAANFHDAGKLSEEPSLDGVAAHEAKKEQIQVFGDGFLPLLVESVAVDLPSEPLPSEVPSWFELDFSTWSRSVHDKFEALRKAIETGVSTEFFYLSSGGERVARRVDPYKLVLTRNAWQLRGYCHKIEAQRMFRLSRIRDVQVTNHAFSNTPQTGVAELPSTMGGKLVNLSLWADRSAAYRVYDEFEEDSVILLSDGNFNITTEVEDDEWLLGYLLSFGAQLIVLEPRYIREHLRVRLMEIFRAYVE